MAEKAPFRRKKLTKEGEGPIHRKAKNPIVESTHLFAAMSRQESAESLPWRILLANFSHCSGISCFVQLVALGLTAALIFGCGGDFDEIRNLRSLGESIVCFGDSLTEGVGAGSGEDYPTVLSKNLARPVVNAGRRGDTTTQALERIGETVLSKDPRLVVVLLGGNDFLRRVPRLETERNLEEIVRRLQAHGAMVVIAGMRLGLFTDEYGPIYEQTARRLGALYIPGVMRGILSDATLRSDPIHPNGAGYRLVAERIGEKLKPLLREADRLRIAGAAG